MKPYGRALSQMLAGSSQFAICVLYTLVKIPNTIKTCRMKMYTMKFTMLGWDLK